MFIQDLIQQTTEKESALEIIGNNLGNSVSTSIFFSTPLFYFYNAESKHIWITFWRPLVGCSSLQNFFFLLNYWLKTWRSQNWSSSINDFSNCTSEYGISTKIHSNFCLYLQHQSGHVHKNLPCIIYWFSISRNWAIIEQEKIFQMLKQ